MRFLKKSAANKECRRHDIHFLLSVRLKVAPKVLKTSRKHLCNSDITDTLAPKNMRKLLISWMALHNDFSGNEVNITGPNYFYHKYHYRHEKHILLFTPNSETRAEFLQNRLNLDFPDHQLELKSVNIGNLSDLQEVKTKTESILLSFNEYEIDIFFSPGSSIMQLSWYICHTTLGLSTRLIQLLRPEHSRNPERPDIVFIESSLSDIPRSAIIRQNYANDYSRKKEDFLLTKSIEPVYRKAEKIAQTDNVSLLITGDTGTGKEHLARYVHQKSARHDKAFEALNCAGLSDQLLESRLFGHKKGSFTGAFRSEKGIFGKAEGGTVFLDEIGDISRYMQQVLLRVLQEKEIRPVGGNIRKTDIRIISATNKNLLKLVSEGSFRSDLYYRLAVTDLHLPALKERELNEKQALIEHFLEQKQKQLKKNRKLKLSKELYNALLEYSFPGNIRELENLIERLYVFSEYEADLNDLPPHFHFEQNNDFDLEECKRRHIRKTYRYFNQNKEKAARAMGISVNTLKKYIDFQT